MSRQPPEQLHKRVSKAKRRHRKERKSSGPVKQSCLGNLPSLLERGTKRMAYLPSDPFTPVGVVSFTVAELAAALGRRPDVVQRWVRSETFPPPDVEVEGMRQRVYTAGRARHLVRVMGEHQQETSYYRRDHDETRKRLFDI